MMSGSRSALILDGWREAARSATMPSEPPSPPRSSHPLSLAATGATIFVLAIVFIDRGSGGGSGGPVGAATASGVTPSVSLVAPGTPAMSPSSNPTERSSPTVGTSSELCSPIQLALGKPTNDTGFAPAGYASNYVTQPVQNSGAAACVLNLPALVSAASATGPFESVPAANAGTVSATIKPGQMLSIVLGAWWPASGEQGVPSQHCTGEIADVTRVRVALGSGDLTINLGTVWRELCATPTRMSLTIQP
jgi:hypothetical protein